MTNESPSHTFQGAYTAIVTPFNCDLSIDYDSLLHLLERQISAGITGLIVQGTTGESPTVSWNESMRIFEFATEYVRRCSPEMELIFGTGSNCTDKAAENQIEASQFQPDGFLIVNPYYNKPSQNGLLQHFDTLAKATPDTAIMLYNIMGRTGVNLETDTLIRLAAANPNIRGVKEASGNLKQIGEVISRLPSDFSVLSGDDNLTQQVIEMGGQGVVSVLSNIMPQEVCRMVSDGLAGNYAATLSMHQQLEEKMKACFIGGNPAAIKFILWRAGLIQPVLRQPLVFPTVEEQKRINDIFFQGKDFNPIPEPHVEKVSSTRQFLPRRLSLDTVGREG